MKARQHDRNDFTLKYFLHGPYKGVKTTGLSLYLGKYYWARRFYANLISSITPLGGSILEIGCGFGDLLGFLENKYDTIGIDISLEAINEAKRRLKRTKLIMLDAEKITRFKIHLVDTVVACNILEHLKDPQNVIKKISKVLKPGGFLFMVVPNTDSIGKKIKGVNWVGFRDKTHISLINPSNWHRLLQTEGFIIKKTFGDGLWDSPYIPLLPSLLQKFIFGIPAAIQAVLSLPFIPASFAESLVVLARKK